MTSLDVTHARALGRPWARRALGPWGFSVALAVLAAVLVVGWVQVLSPLDVPVEMPWWFVAALTALADGLLVDLHLRRDSYSTSLSELPLVVGLVFANPVALVVGRIVGLGATMALHKRQRGVKLFFNLAQEALTASLAVVVFRAILGNSSPMAPDGWVAAFVAVLLVDAISPISVVCAISLNNGRAQWSALPRLVALDVIAGAANTSLALLAVIVMWHEPSAAWLLPVLAGIVYMAYRGYASLAQRYARLELLYSFTRALGSSLQPEALVKTMLGEARELLQAEVAELILFGQPRMRATLSGEDVTTNPLPDVDQTEAWWWPAAHGSPVCIARQARESSRAQLDDERFKDAMAAPLRWGSDIIGVLIVANRLGDVVTFTPEDLRLFETLANHASVSIENGRLVQRLRQEADQKEHQALHDALTGLPNRRLFQREIDTALERAADTDRQLAVVLMDLDRFKEVNDTLGHHTGDLLLGEVGKRLKRTLQGRGTIARLGGDEFGIMLPEVSGAEDAAALAHRILESLEYPFTLDEITLEVEASLGVALAPEHGTDSATLLQRADVAMYVAKRGHAGVQVYEPADDRYTRRRLSLVGELRQALASDQLIVYYQPKVGLTEDRVTGVEALVRWIHPVHGFLPPDEFIPLAEQTGLVRPLTSFVLERALSQCAAWRAEGRDLGVAVNLSVRSLVDPGLPDEVARLLADAGVPATALTLEITESSLMVDPGRSAAVLERLHALGVTLSIDDFGTGYSTLTYLKRLPVGELKIDRSFVIGMAGDENDSAIVESTIVLAHSLGLHVVAEGVENAEVLGRLARLGCDAVQGYFFSRPLPPDELGQWLAENACESSLLSAR